MKQKDKEILNCFIVALLLSFLLLIYLIFGLDKSFFLERNNLKDIRMGPEFGTFEHLLVISPGYFRSMGEVQAIFHSKLAFGINLELSLHNSSWTNIKLHYSDQTRNMSGNFKTIGNISLDQTTHTIYGRIKNNQEYKIVPGKTEKEVLESLQLEIKVYPRFTNKDIIIALLVFITSLGTTYSLLYTNKKNLFKLIQYCLRPIFYI